MKKVIVLLISLMFASLSFAEDFKIQEKTTIQRANDSFKLTSEWEKTEGGYAKYDYNYGDFKASLWVKDGSSLVLTAVDISDKQKGQLTLMQAMATCGYFAVASTGMDGDKVIKEISNVITESITNSTHKATSTIDGIQYESSVSIVKSGMVLACSNKG